MDYTELTAQLEHFMPTFGDLFQDFYNQLLTGDVPGFDIIWEMGARRTNDVNNKVRATEKLFRYKDGLL